MKKALLLFAALLVAGCGEKSSSEGSKSASGNPTPSNESTEPSADTAKPPPAEPPVAESASESPTPSNESAEPSADTAKPIPAEPPSEEPSDTPNSLSDADVERLVKEAVEFDSIEERDDLYYLPNESEPYSGWAKKIYGSRQVQMLAQFKDGKPDGPITTWHENGKKRREGTYKDGEVISAKWWNSKGEEVATMEESEK